MEGPFLPYTPYRVISYGYYWHIPFLIEESSIFAIQSSLLPSLNSL